MYSMCALLSFCICFNIANLPFAVHILSHLALDLVATVECRKIFGLLNLSWGSAGALIKSGFGCGPPHDCYMLYNV